MIEKELKEIIAESTYNTLQTVFNWQSDFIQKNNYYTDKNNVLYSHNITVRIREKCNEIKLQIKMPVSEDKALHIKSEYEEDMTTVPQFIDGEKLSDIIGVPIENCYLTGSLRTERKALKWDDSTEICLDKNTYLNTTDYEIEIEYLNDINQDLISNLASYGVLLNRPTNGKYSRFMERLKDGF